MKIKDKILSETSEEVKQRVRDTANKLVMKQETLEEAAERISPIQQVINFITENFQKEGEARQLSMDLLKKWCEVKLLNEESKWQQQFNDTSEVTRVEVIQHSEPYNGRAYTNYDAKEVEIQLQDRGKTLKIFLK